MKILVSGSHGLVGRALLKRLSAEGHETFRLVRGETEPGSPDIRWNPGQGTIDEDRISGIDAVIHLAGENIAGGRWTDAKKKAILESRVKGTIVLSEALVKMVQPPSTLISASAIGYYGDRGDQLLTEDSAPGSGFLADVCRQWEAAAQPAVEKGIRVVFARFGIILDADEGALAKMLPPFRMGAGGRVGDGKQWMSWIAVDDVTKALSFVLQNNSLHGPVNFVAPKPVTNAEFTKALGTALSRPTLFPIPAFGVRLIFGEMADALLLVSQKVEPQALETAGFEFDYPNIDAALKQVLREK